MANEVSIAVTRDAAEPAMTDIFTVSLRAASMVDTVVGYTVSGTATAGVDDTAPSGTVTIAAGATRAVIDVAVLDDTDLECAEDLIVTLDTVDAGDANVLSGASNAATMILDEDEISPVNGSATLTITPGGGRGCATSGGTTAFSAENTGGTGEAQITAITLDLPTAMLPDLVFDPVGAGRDPTAPVCPPNGATASVTGLAPFTDNAVDPFTGLRNGGFDAVSMSFTDCDPNSTQGGPGAGNAGAVSGYELIGSTVTLTFDDGTTQKVATSSLYEDGSLGGAQSVSQTVLSTATVLDAPTIALEGPASDASTTLPRDQVYAPDGETAQTIRVTGTPKATVSLLQLYARLFIALVADPFDVQPDEAPFYANEAMDGKVLFLATLDAQDKALSPVRHSAPPQNRAEV